MKARNKKSKPIEGTTINNKSFFPLRQFFLFEFEFHLLKCKTAKPAGECWIERVGARGKVHFVIV